MSDIITTTELQRNIGKIVKSAKSQPYVVTGRGKGKLIILPYMKNFEDRIEEYMEDFEMNQNKAKLKKRYKDSEKSGLGKLKV